MNTITDFDPVLQTTIQYFSKKTNSYNDIATSMGISKQAVHQRVTKGVEFFSSFRVENKNNREVELGTIIQRQKEIIKTLQLQLLIKSVLMSYLKCFKEKILKFYPKFKVARYSARQKLYVLQMLGKFQRKGGQFKEFCKGIGKSPETIKSWKKRYEERGYTGLHDKTTRPKNFGNKVPLKIKKYLMALFIRFPRWTDYQYNKYMRSNPEHSYYISLPTIQKIRRMHKVKSEMEKERIKKRWCFNNGTDVWTVDFTCMIKTDSYKLQLLTVSDARSRFLFKTALLLDTSTDIVVDYLSELFIKYGKPTIIKVDNGPEFRTDCRNKIRELSIYLFNSPSYYGQFNSAHERIHRTLKGHIDKFETHKNLTTLVEQVNTFEDEYNYKMKNDYLEDRTPSDVYFNDKEFVPKNENIEVVTPYEKDGEMRAKFTTRHGEKGRVVIDTVI